MFLRRARHEVGVPEIPVNAVPPSAWARCQLRFVVGSIQPRSCRRCAAISIGTGSPMVQVSEGEDELFDATPRPEDAWVTWVADSLAKTTGRRLPSSRTSGDLSQRHLLRGPQSAYDPGAHSYPGCSQHAPNEHLPIAIAREGLAIMAGLYWDLGAGETPPIG